MWPIPKISIILHQNGERYPDASLPGASYDAQDRIKAYDDMTFQTTDAGDVVQRINGPTSAARTGNDGREFVYSRPLGALRTATVGGDTVAYESDPFGRRVGRWFNGGTKKGWIYSDGLRIIAEIDNNAARTIFIYGIRQNVPELMIKSGTTYYRIITDHLGGVRLVVNVDTGAIAQRLDYDAWGRVTVDTNPGFQPFGFAGGLHDPLTQSGVLGEVWGAAQCAGPLTQLAGMGVLGGSHRTDRARGVRVVGHLGGVSGGPSASKSGSCPVSRRGTKGENP